MMSFRDVDIKVRGLLKGERKTNKESIRFPDTLMMLKCTKLENLANLTLPSEMDAYI